MKAPIVYVLKCADGSLYTGYTVDLALRLGKHRRGKGARYTRSRLPVRLLAWWSTEDLKGARSTEARFKQLTRPQKLAALKAGRAFGYRIRKHLTSRVG